MELTGIELIVLLLSLVLDNSFATGSPGNSGSSGESGDRTRVRKCEPISVDLCQGLGYNVTGFPNFVGHETQTDAGLQLGTFTPLIQYGCSTELRFFLCSVYAPMCTEKVPEVIGPCRSVCEYVRSRCEPLLLKFGFPWPSNLNCSKFHPFNGHQHMCMEGTKGNGTDKDSLGEAEFDPRTRTVPGPSVGGRSTAGVSSRVCHSTRFLFSNRSRSCLLRCDQSLSFAQKDKDVMDVWMTVWSVLGLLSAVFVSVTFLVDVTGFNSAERHVVFMTLCYGMCGVAFAVRVVAGRDVISCVAIDPPKDYSYVLPKNGLASTDCTVLFVLLYYFTMAGVVWWVLLTITWLFVAGLHWTLEATQRLATYFHIVAWTVPAVLVIVILVRKNIEPSEYSGMCHVTSTDPDAIAGFLLAPMVACLFVGATFLLGGLVGYCQRKSGQRNGEPATRSSLENAWQGDRDAVVRVATFALISSVPLLGMTACVLIGYISIDRDRSNPDTRSLEGPGVPDTRTEPRPVAVFLVEVLLSVLIAIFSAFRTLLSARTKQAWRGFCCRRCDRGSKDGRFPPGPRLSSTSPTFAPSSYRSHQGNRWIGARQKQRESLITDRIQFHCSTFNHPKIHSSSRNPAQNTSIAYIL